MKDEFKIKMMMAKIKEVYEGDVNVIQNDKYKGYKVKIHVKGKDYRKLVLDWDTGEDTYLKAITALYNRAMARGKI